MPQHIIDQRNAIAYNHKFGQNGMPTFVFFNALTGTDAMWRAVIAPALEAEGYGTLSWNYRGQEGSPVSAEAEITAASMTSDAITLLKALAPLRPIYVGMSIGGLFAINAHLQGSRAEAMLLINTLRIDGPRLRWVNAATHRAARTGGLRLLRDLYGPLIFGEPWQASNFETALADEPYEPLAPDHNDARLLASGGTADWNLPYESITVPVTVLSGLQDRVFFDIAVVDRLTKRIPDARRVDLEHAAHMLPIEDPKAVITACRELAGRSS